MHQSRKEQGLKQASRSLLHPDLREARTIAEMEANMEAAAEWADFPKRPTRNCLK